MTSSPGLPGNERVPMIWDFHCYDQENLRQTGFSGNRAVPYFKLSHGEWINITGPQEEVGCSHDHAWERRWPFG